MSEPLFERTYRAFQASTHGQREDWKEYCHLIIDVRFDRIMGAKKKYLGFTWFMENEWFGIYLPKKQSLVLLDLI